MAVSYLAHHFGRDFLNFNVPLLDQIGRSKIELLLRVIEQKVNTPLTSSCGRLFDAVAALAGIRQTVNYEAQAAIELEMAIADASCDEVYAFELVLEKGTYIIGTRLLFAAVLRDLRDQVPAGVISARFHNGLVELFVGIANILRERSSLDRVCLSGGTFNNVYLKEGLCHDYVSTSSRCSPRPRFQPEMVGSASGKQSLLRTAWREARLCSRNARRASTHLLPYCQNGAICAHNNLMHS